ncbi:ABC transporter permease [Chungangia koreensis]|uniref:ABC transporter permease n=1 Tax=Chungangia koreensis TaxID=752657 RepID=A0ABV8X488_9LACT
MRVKALFKNRLFLIGFSIIGTFLFISLFYWAFFGDDIPRLDYFLEDENGKLLRPPYSGSIYPPLGTDEFGRNIFIVMIVGFKYTLLAALIITFLRVVPSVFFGLAIHYIFGRFERPIKSLADSINYFPTTLLAYLLLFYMSFAGIYMEDPAVPGFWGRVAVFIVILSLIFIPANSVLIANEVKKIDNMEFIEVSRTLGADTARIILQHIRPFLVPQLYIIFIREFIQTLLLMSHLGVLGIFIGGSIVRENLFYREVLTSRSDEWTGLIGLWWQYLWTTYPWISVIPIVAFTVLILSAKCMLEGTKEVYSAETATVQVAEKQQVIIDPAIPPFQLLSTAKKRQITKS